MPMEDYRPADSDELLSSYFRSEVAAIRVPPAPGSATERDDREPPGAVNREFENGQARPDAAAARSFRRRVSRAGVRLLVAAALAAAVSVPLWYDPMSSPGARVVARYYRETGDGQKIANALADIQRYLRSSVYRQ